jgi:hypothetical protein
MFVEIRQEQNRRVFVGTFNSFKSASKFMNRVNITTSDSEGNFARGIKDDILNFKNPVVLVDAQSGEQFDWNNDCWSKLEAVI